MSTKLEDRFWSKVDAEGDCWEWTAALNPGGYGSFTWEGKSLRAHRSAYELLVGPIPDGLTIDHLCRNPPCVNPDHLEVVTRAENTRRGYNPTAKNARRTYCVNGHRLAGDNLRMSKDGHRVCRACKAARPRVVSSEICAIDGCSGPLIARSYCNKHYQRWRIHGNPLTRLPPRNRYG